MTRRIALALALLACASLAQDKPLTRFAVIADVQFADKDTAGAREYRASPGKLERAAAEINQIEPAFAIQLGDLIDEGVGNMDRILAAYDRIGAKKYHVVGNHDAAGIGRRELLKRWGLSNSYYEFSEAGWR